MLNLNTIVSPHSIQNNHSYCKISNFKRWSFRRNISAINQIDSSKCSHKIILYGNRVMRVRGCWGFLNSAREPVSGNSQKIPRTKTIAHLFRPNRFFFSMSKFQRINIRFIGVNMCVFRERACEDFSYELCNGIQSVRAERFRSF